jgi:hypothetical protein
MGWSLDTHEFFKPLQSVGFSGQQAEAFTPHLHQTKVSASLGQARYDYGRANLATQRDLKRLEFRPESSIKDTGLKIAVLIRKPRLARDGYFDWRGQHENNG